MKYTLPLITMLIWGGNNIVNKLAVSLVEPSVLSFYRWLVAFVILTPVCLPGVWKKRHIIKPHLAKLAVLAMLGMVVNQSLAYYAGLTTSASNMSLIISLVPLLSVFIAVPILGSKLSPAMLAGGITSLFGLAFMLGKGNIFFLFQHSPTEGDVLMLGSAISNACYCVLLRRWRIPISDWFSVYVQCVFALIMLTPLWLGSNNLIPVVESIPHIAFAGIGASIIAPVLWIKTIESLGVETSAMYMNLIPIITVGLAMYLLGEQLETYHALGGGMVVLGVVLAQLKRKAAINKAEEPEEVTAIKKADLSAS